MRGAHLQEYTGELLARLHGHISEDSGQGGHAGLTFEEAAAHPPQEGFLQGLSAAVAEVQAWQEAGEGGKAGWGCGPLPSPQPPAPPSPPLQPLTPWRPP